MDTVWPSEALHLHITSQMGDGGQEGTTCPESLRDLVEVTRRDPSLPLSRVLLTQLMAKCSGPCDWPSLGLSVKTSYDAVLPGSAHQGREDGVWDWNMSRPCPCPLTPHP